MPKVYPKGQNCAAALDCAGCGRECKWTPSEPDGDPAFGGWYCKRCDTYTEADVEVED